MTEEYFTTGGTCIAFFSNETRTASICITKTEYQTSVIKTPNDSPLKLLRWRKFTKCSKEWFFKIYHAAVSVEPGKQQALDLLGLHAAIPEPDI